ncbi:PAS domain S-box protein [Egbenema bharatensis]|uniref:PAS domain S-box protein n=1 Tax=Egbenema bharatensis TaxID=3463334 RepID=UPI003A8B1F9B
MNPTESLVATPYAAFDLLHTSIWICDLQTLQIQWVNQAVLELWQTQSLDQLCSRDLSVITNFDPLRLSEYMAQFQQGKTVQERWRFYPPEQPIDLECYCSSIPSAEGQSVMLIEGRIIDRVQEDLLRLQSATLEACANSIVITNRQGIIQWVNPAYEKLTGYTYAESIGKTPGELVQSGAHPQEFYRDLWRTILAGQVWHGEVINRRRDNSLYIEEMTITPVYDRHHEISHFIAIKQDISERKLMEERRAQAEAALRQSEVRFRGIFETAAIGIGLTTLEGDLLDCNSATLQMLGYSREELQHLNFRQYSHPDDLEEDLRLYEELLAGRCDSYQMEKRYIRKNGQVFWAGSRWQSSGMNRENRSTPLEC